MSKKEEIIALLNPIIEDEGYFLVEGKVSFYKLDIGIHLLVDSDSGITIDQCGYLSRKIVVLLDSEGLENYELEVSSPGVGEPLLLERQYLKNIGRRIKIIHKEGRTIIGKLTEVKQGEYITIEVASIVKGKKKTEWTSAQIPFSQISKAEIEVDFNKKSE